LACTTPQPASGPLSDAAKYPAGARPSKCIIIIITVPDVDLPKDAKRLQVLSIAMFLDTMAGMQIVTKKCLIDRVMKALHGVDNA
jgi:hypothetical protein